MTTNSCLKLLQATWQVWLLKPIVDELADKRTINRLCYWSPDKL